jgi:hypothetical protein
VLKTLNFLIDMCNELLCIHGKSLTSY